MGLTNRVLGIWTAFKERIDDLRIEDPSNPKGNDLSPTWGDSEREALSGAATIALDLVEKGDWESIFGDEEPTSKSAHFSESRVDRAILSSKQLLALGDASHREEAPWLVRRTNYSLKLSCTKERNGKEAPLENDGLPVLEDTHLRFVADTNVPEPHKILWQVVNTGQHAESSGDLRGKKFFEGKLLGGGTSPDQRVNWEGAKYTGKHWIECFVVKNDELWCRSGPFYVSVINRTRKGTPWRPRFRRR